MNLLEQEPQPAELSYRTIPLTQGQFTLVDLEDYEYLSRFNWRADWSERMQCFYAVRWSGTGRKGRKALSMHRELMGCPEAREVDHKDHDTLNNRRYNLRVATTAQNQFNRRKNRNNKSGFKGVSASKKAGKWCAQIQINGKNKSLGTLFDTPEAAHEAYKIAALELFGEYANF